MRVHSVKYEKNNSLRTNIFNYILCSSFKVTLSTDACPQGEKMNIQVAHLETRVGYFTAARDSTFNF